jgi:hypothetical protein
LSKYILSGSYSSSTIEDTLGLLASLNPKKVYESNPSNKRLIAADRKPSECQSYIDDAGILKIDGRPLNSLDRVAINESL